MSRRECAVLGLILVAGLILRFYRISYHSLWLDELVTWYVSGAPSISEATSRYFVAEVTPPLYYLVQFLSLHLVGDTEFGLRFLSAVCGTLSILAIYRYARTFYGITAGLASAAVLATSYQAIYFSQEARAYSLVILMTGLSGWAWFSFLGAVRNSQNLFWPSLFYIISASLLGASHYFGILMVFTQALSVFIVCRSWSEIRKWLALYLTVFFMSLPDLIWIRAHSMRGAPISQPPPFSDLFIYHRWLFGSSSLYGVLSTLIIGWSMWVGKNSKELRQAIVLIFWILFPFVLAWAASHVKPIYSARYMAIGIFPMYFLIGISIPNLWKARRTTNVMSAVVVLVLCFLGVYETIVSRQHYAIAKSEQRKETTSAIAGLVSKYPNSLILSVEPPFLLPISNYYFEKLGLNQRVEGLLSNPATAADDVRKLLRSDQRTLILAGFGLHENNRAMIDSLSEFPILERSQMNRSGVWVFQVTPAK